MGLKVVVTGGSSGIGRAAALRFSKDGHEVFVVARTDANLSETVRLAEVAGGGKVYKGVGDVRVEADVERNYEEAIEVLGDIDVIILNAGLGWPGPLEDYSAADYDEIFDTNVRGVFLWLKAVLPAMKRKGSGQIVLMNSVNGEDPKGPYTTLYTATKFAVRGLALALRLELKSSGIKVASVYPGPVDTGMWFLPQWNKQKEVLQSEIREQYRLDKALSPDDVADVVANITYQGPKSDIEKVSIQPTTDF